MDESALKSAESAIEKEFSERNPGKCLRVLHASAENKFVEWSMLFHADTFGFIPVGASDRVRLVLSITSEEFKTSRTRRVIFMRHFI
jgi:hypothetical protein